jgi:AmiR/NasT family two-component response regulator
VAAVVSVAAAIVLIALAPAGRATVGVVIYGIGLIALFAGSALYHRWPGPARFKPVLQRLDHSTIFLFIAASYTPIALVAPIVVSLGHEVIAREIEVKDVAAVTARERPDVALVGLGESSVHALDLIDKIVREAACPVIVLLHAPDPAFVKEASKRGVFAHISDDDVDEWQSSIDIVLRRFAEYHALQGAFGRRALTERAKGILMERHSIDEAAAFEMLRERSRLDNRKLIDLAAAVVDGHRLLPRHPAPE